MLHNQIPTTPGTIRIHRLDAAAVEAVIVGAKVVILTAMAITTVVVTMIMIEVADIVMGIAVDMVVAINRVISGQLKVKSAVTPVGLGRTEYKEKLRVVNCVR